MSSGRVCHFKLVLLGDTAVGKSCLVVRFVRDEFFEYQEPTIGGEARRTVSLPVSSRLAVDYALLSRSSSSWLVSTNRGTNNVKRALSEVPRGLHGLAVRFL